MKHILLLILSCHITAVSKGSPNDGPSYLTLKDKDLPKDYLFQGEYIAQDIGVQVISLANGFFQAVVYSGGLPGAGWNKINKSLIDGKLNDNEVTLTRTVGTRRYLAEEPSLFSATEKFPPPGQRVYSGSISSDGILTLSNDKNNNITLKKIIRKSPTLDKAPPEDAIVLFDGSSTEAFVGGRLDSNTNFLHTDGRDILTKKKFLNYRMHLEFMLPYRPSIRGQHRGNSGFYQVDLYEMQILDSFGLEGKHFDCGGIYSQVPPLVNACLPPLNWQTYDVVFHSAIFRDGKKSRNARITAKLNGILIHDKYELPGRTGGSRNEPEGTAGPIKLQGHANPLQFRNIWIQEI